MHIFGSRVATRDIGSFHFALTRYRGDSVLPWHEHSEPYLTVVLDGHYRESLRGDTRECAPQSIVYHPAGETHADTFGPRAASCLDVRFDPAWLAAVGGRGCTIERTAVLDGFAARRVASRILREFRRADSFSEMVIEASLLEFFVEKERASKSSAVPSWLRRVRDLLETSERKSLAEIASIAGVHRAHLTRAFRTHYGCTIGEFIRARKIDRARDRLRGSEPLAAIATDLGFADQSHFARTFRRVTGQTPASYRRASR